MGLIEWGILQEIANERTAQDKQWGGPKHDDRHDLIDWLDFIESQATRSRRYEWELSWELKRTRLVKIAALAIAALQSGDRRAKK